MRKADEKFTVILYNQLSQALGLILPPLDSTTREQLALTMHVTRMSMSHSRQMRRSDHQATPKEAFEKLAEAIITADQQSTLYRQAPIAVIIALKKIESQFFAPPLYLEAKYQMMNLWNKQGKRKLLSLMK